MLICGARTLSVEDADTNDTKYVKIQIDEADDEIIQEPKKIGVSPGASPNKQRKTGMAVQDEVKKQQMKDQLVEEIRTERMFDAQLI